MLGTTKTQTFDHIESLTINKSYLYVYIQSIQYLIGEVRMMKIKAICKQKFLKQ